jgi:hypothetical protein
LVAHFEQAFLNVLPVALVIHAHDSAKEHLWIICITNLAELVPKAIESGVHGANELTITQQLEQLGIGERADESLAK